MSRGEGRGLPPGASRFQKGLSGNPKGRPRKTPPTVSAFDVIMEQTLTVMQGGKPRELSVEEALQHKTYQDALAGNRAARREVLKMIAKREKWLAAKTPKKTSPVEVLTEACDPRNADEAMKILGIAEPDPKWAHYQFEQERLVLSTWAVQAALSRRGRKSLTERDVSEIRRCTRDPDMIRWPASTQL